MTEIYYYSCYGCTSLSSVHLPKNLEIIGGNAFGQCKSLSNIEFPEGLKKLNNDAFKGAKLTSIVLPNSLDEIGGQCFRENLFSEITNI